MRLVAIFLAVNCFYCTYDSTPPGDDKINDSKPTLVIDATALTASRAVRLTYTDSLGSATLQTSAEKTDASGRLLYPLLMTHGTRSYSVTIAIDQNGDGNFVGTGDLTYTTPASAFALDTDIKNLKLTVADFTVVP